MFYRRAGLRYGSYEEERRLFPLAVDRALIVAVLALAILAPFLVSDLHLSSYLLSLIHI